MRNLKKLIRELALSNLKDKEYYVLDPSGLITEEVNNWEYDASAKLSHHGAKHNLFNCQVTSIRYAGATIHILKYEEKKTNRGIRTVQPDSKGKKA